jgi:hypothetical protein
MSLIYAFVHACVFLKVKFYAAGYRRKRSNKYLIEKRESFGEEVVTTPGLKGRMGDC